MISRALRELLQRLAGFVLRLVAILFAAITLVHDTPVLAATCQLSNGGFNFGAVEQGNNKTGSNVYVNPTLIYFWQDVCGDTEKVTFNNGTDPTHFPLVNPSPVPTGAVSGCLPSVTLTAGQFCAIQVTFVPNGPGPYTSTITAMPSDANVTTYELAGAEFSVSPLTDQEVPPNFNNFQLMLPSPMPTPYPGYASVTLNSGTAQLTWSGSLSYHTTGHVPAPPALPAEITIPQFSTENSKSYTLGFGATPIPSGMPPPTGKLIQVAGGQLTLNVKYNAGGLAGAATRQLIGTVSGIPEAIPSPAINSALISAYQTEYQKAYPKNSPPTSSLLEGIALRESSYRQFDYVENFYAARCGAPSPLFGVDTLWPLESCPNDGPPPHPSGFAVGLMQNTLTVTTGTPATKSATEMSTAFNWIANVQTAASTLVSKLSSVASVQIAAKKQNPNVPAPGSPGALSALQEEQMAVFDYGGYLPPGTASIGGKKVTLANLPENQLLTPQCIGGPNNGQQCNGTCTCEWAENPCNAANNLCTSANTEVDGECYVCAVYGNTLSFCNNLVCN